MNIEVDEIGNEYVFGASQKICMAIARIVDEETIKMIRKYCEKKGIIPQIIAEDKLELVLRLGIQALAERELGE